MKKLFFVFLSICIILSLVACGGKGNVNNNEQIPENGQQIEENLGIEENKEESDSGENNPQNQDKPSDVTDKKPETKPEAKPEVKPEVKPEAKPETKPEVKPEAKPETKPEAKPETQATTAGQKLLEDFKSKAQSSESAVAIAEAVSGNSMIPFSVMAVPVEEGFLAGFGNTEIKGFKEGAMFGPVIGSVPFVGYVFVLDEVANTEEFVSTLKSNADLRWNICVEAEEMVAGSVGNKVFFVMCNKDLTAE